MGVSPFRHSGAGSAEPSSVSEGAGPTTPAPPPTVPANPDPSRFTILGAYECPLHHGYVAVQIQWHGVGNYEGRKILVYRATKAEIMRAERLDPHFAAERGPLVPIARFEPTTLGWRMAIECVDRESGRT